MLILVIGEDFLWGEQDNQESAGGWPYKSYKSIYGLSVTVCI